MVEMYQVQKYLAAHHGLPFEDKGQWGSRVLGEVPDGEHVVPLGVSETPTRVVVRDGLITIDPVTGLADLLATLAEVSTHGVPRDEVQAVLVNMIARHALCQPTIGRLRARWPQECTPTVLVRTEPISTG